ncbi:SixA phosphatase family protein [Propionibacterium sp.]|uniref:SixA phosphatase family protein n=1 Tax=Propionibacterium sp. TaxID=1977903 RepID=UPI0039E80B8D
MSRTLYLMRHAEASSFAASDVNRPLSRHGRKQASQMGAMLAGAKVGLAMVSPAARTRETFARMRLHGPDGAETPVQVVDDLYGAGTSTLLQAIGAAPQEAQVLLVLAHAPGIPTLAAQLRWAGTGNEADLHAGFSTATAAGFSVDCEWDELAGFDAFAYADPAAPHDCPVTPLGAPLSPTV